MPMSRKLFTFFLFAALCVAGCARDERGGAASEALVCAEGNAGLSLPEGFCAVLVADSVGGARHMAVAENGDVFVALRNLKRGGGIAALRDSTGDGRADRLAYFGAPAGTGIGFHGDYLYFAPDTAVVRYRLAAGALTPADTSYELIVSGFPQQGPHATKPFTFDNAGHMYVTVGAPSNNCADDSVQDRVVGLEPCPQIERQAGIWQFSADTPGQQQQSGVHYVKGFRNALALDWHPAANKLYAVQHGRDVLSQNWPALYNDTLNAELPAEEFSSIDQGDDFGWPYCYYDHIQKKRVTAPEYGGDGRSADRCTAFRTPDVGLPGHWAPNDLVIYTGEQFPERYRNGAFIAFHGSWNRAPLPQGGYNVVFIPFVDGKPTGAYEVFADGFAGVKPVASPGDALHRPTGLAVGPDGSLYVSDSVKGKIWRIIYRGS